MIDKKDLPEGWTAHVATKMNFPYAECFYQKKVFTYESRYGTLEGIYADIIEYSPIEHGDINVPNKWELEVYLPDDYNVTNKAMKVKVYTYDTLDFVLAEVDAKGIIRKLRKPQIKINYQNIEGGPW